MDSNSKIEAFNTSWRNIDVIYSEYAKRIGLNYTSMHVLNLIAVLDVTTQSILCERTLLPKQTINVVITQFYKEGLIELKEVAEDRRNKTIHLTEKGKEFVEKYINHIMESEKLAMASMSEDESDALVRNIRRYEEVFRERLLKE